MNSRGCGNYKHEELDWREQPCLSCDHVDGISNWEPVDEQLTQILKNQKLMMTWMGIDEEGL